MMARSKKKLDAKSFAQQKRHRRQWVTFLRMCRYGVNNFSRNAWLTIAATAVMTITLLIVFSSLAARNILVDTVDDLRDRVNMSIYVKTDIDEPAIRTIQADLQKLPSVTEVTYVTPSQAREIFVRDNANNPATLDAVSESTNQLPGTFNIKIENINDTSELETFVAGNQTYLDNRQPNRNPTFAGDRRVSIERIADAANFAQQAGIVASAVFVSISMLIIFNTIRMAIFNRREEITMMKLIGAERSFIRGPFIVEAIVYGFFAAIVATALGYVALLSVAPSLAEAEVNIGPTIDIMTVYAGLVILGMIILGAIIGVISSLLATRRYLKL